MKKVQDKLLIVLLTLFSIIIFAVGTMLVCGSSTYSELMTTTAQHEVVETVNADGSTIQFYSTDLADAEPSEPDIAEPEATDPDNGKGNLTIWYLAAAILVLLLVVEALFFVQLLHKPKKAIADATVNSASPDIMIFIKPEADSQKVTDEVKEEPVEDEAAAAEIENVEEAVEETPEEVAPESEDDDSESEEDSEETLPLFTEDGSRLFYDKSFSARLALAESQIKEYYSELKNYILSYSGVRSRVSWHYEAFNKGRTNCVKLQLRGKSIYMYIALAATELPEKYNIKDVSGTSRYAGVPTVFKIRKPRSIKHAKELVAMLMERLNVEQGAIPSENYVTEYETAETLIEKGLIKVKVTNSYFAAPVIKNDVSEE